MTNEEKINLIGQKILLLSNNLDKYKAELLQLEQQLNALKSGQQQQPVFQTPPPPVIPVDNKATPPVTNEPDNKTEIFVEEPIEAVKQPFAPAPQNTAQATKTVPGFNFEEFIGAKLINIIGIIILVIGLGIGVKYAIDEQLLGPLARIALAYLAGGILLALALKLKAKFKTFSAILLSGGMASLYFTTFAAYSMYNLFPQLAAFGIMVVFTAFTVFAATVYALEIIGIIGLVGAYAVPMLLSDGSGKIGIMFAYMTIINSGILVLSFKKLWRVLNYFAFAFTWLIVAVWFAGRYNYQEHFGLVMAFSFLFFIVFYVSNLSYKVAKNEPLTIGDVIHLLLNSYIFFAIGYNALDNEAYKEFTGLFSLGNAVVHLVVAYIIVLNNKRSENKLVDKKLFYLLMAMVLSFFTIAVPVQLDGNWVTLLWAAEAVLMFSIGRIKSIRFYEGLGYIMAVLSIGSLLQDWQVYNSYLNTYVDFTPFLNIHLFTSLFVAGALGTILLIHNKKPLQEEGKTKSEGVYTIAEYLIPLFLLIILYLSFNNELTAFFQSKFQKSVLHVPSDVAWAEPGAMNEIHDYSWLKLKNVVQHIYNFLFFSALSFFVIRNWDNKALRWSTVGINVLVISGFMFAGLYQLSELRNHYLHGEYTQYYSYSSMFVSIRYICFVLFGILLYLTHKLLQKAPFSAALYRAYSGAAVHVLILIVLSVELIHLNILQNYSASETYYRATAAAYKIGLTALWGIYSFALIAYGIFRKKQATRISAISILGITLLKLLLFDTWNLSTGYKVIAYMLLGIMLLIVAFLYQKFKVLIFGDDEKNESEI